MTTKLQIDELLVAYERATGMGSVKAAHKLLPEIVRALVNYVEEVTAGPTDADIAFFQGKLEAAVERGDEEQAAKLRKQVELLTDAAVIYRLSRAPERRTFFVEVGTLPEEKAREYLVQKMAEAQGEVCPPCDVTGDAPNKIDFGLDELVTRNPAPDAAAAPTGEGVALTISSDGTVEKLVEKPAALGTSARSSKRTAPAPKRPKSPPKKRG